MTNSPLSRRTSLALGLLAGTAATARAADYPTRPVRIIVPYTPGGFTDLSARLVAEPLSRVLRQPVVVENRPGANSILGAGVAASSPPDGYTLVMVLPAHAANATLQAGKMPYDPVTSFTPISVIATSPLVLAGGKHLPARNWAEFLDHAKARPGALTYGSSGIGSTAHLAMELLQIRTGLRMVHAPYRGTQPALQDLMGGNIGALFDIDSALRPQFQAGNIVPLGIAAAERASFAPDLVTFAEHGIADFVVTTWTMLLATAGTPAEIVERISAEITKIVREPAMTARLAEMGLLAEGRTPAQTAGLLRSEVERWGTVIRTANITVD
jgi:tripartite-type tricarboxylate transporter receptor subunit TctC